MNKKVIIFLLGSLFLILPDIILAITISTTTPSDSLTIPLVINAILKLMWMIFIAFAVVMFLIAGFQFLSAQGEPDGVGKARQSVIWGVAGVIVAILAFSLPFIIQNSILNPSSSTPVQCRPAGSACATLPSACCGSCQQVGMLMLCVGP